MTQPQHSNVVEFNKDDGKIETSLVGTLGAEKEVANIESEGGEHQVGVEKLNAEELADFVREEDDNIEAGEDVVIESIKDMTVEQKGVEAERAVSNTRETASIIDLLTKYNLLVVKPDTLEGSGISVDATRNQEFFMITESS